MTRKDLLEKGMRLTACITITRCRNLRVSVKWADGTHVPVERTPDRRNSKTLSPPVPYGTAIGIAIGLRVMTYGICDSSGHSNLRAAAFTFFDNVSGSSTGWMPTSMSWVVHCITERHLSQRSLIRRSRSVSYWGLSNRPMLPRHLTSKRMAEVVPVRGAPVANRFKPLRPPEAP
jgi:hypothetical protein